MAERDRRSAVHGHTEQLPVEIDVEEPAGWSDGRVVDEEPVTSLIETKRTIVAAHGAGIAAARQRENQAFARLLGEPANLEAFAALAERRPPEFAAVDSAHPVDVERHRVD